MKNTTMLTKMLRWLPYWLEFSAMRIHFCFSSKTSGNETSNNCWESDCDMDLLTEDDCITNLLGFKPRPLRRSIESFPHRAHYLFCLLAMRPNSRSETNFYGRLFHAQC